MGYETEKYYQRLNREIEWRESEWFYNIIGQGLCDLFSPARHQSNNNQTTNQHTNNQQYTNHNTNQYANKTNNQYVLKKKKRPEYKFTPISPISLNCQRCGKKIRSEDITCPFCNKVQKREYVTCPNCYNSVKSNISKCPRCNTTL